MIGSLLVPIVEQKCANSLGKPRRTMQRSYSFSTTTPTARRLSLAILIFCKNTFTESLPFLRLCSLSFKFRMLALEVEVNLYSKMFQTSLELVIPTTREKTCVVSVELIKESKALSLILQAENSGFIVEMP